MKSKNIHVLKTDKPSRLLKDLVDGTYQFKKEVSYGNRFELPLNIYITSSDEEIKESDWFHLDMSDNDHPDEIHQMGKNNWSKTGGINFNNNSSWTKCCKKIILTTDQDLINLGVQSIDDEFLEWFVKNPNCERVEVEIESKFDGVDGHYHDVWEIIIPKEEPKQHVELINDNIEEFDKAIKLFKQETLEEVAKEVFKGEYICNGIDIVPAWREGFVTGAKWQQEQEKNKYSEEDMLNFSWFLKENLGQYSCDRTAHFEGKYLEQFKKK